MTGAVRSEKDFLGIREIGADCYYGISTVRAVENFPISDVPLSTVPGLIVAFAQVKKAAALANHDFGLLCGDKFDAIIAACDALIAGELIDQFPIDLVQGGAGTSTNMNVNEVIANKALEILGHPRGRYDIIHPNNDVNMSQSTNDTYPTALRLALYQQISDYLPQLQALATAMYEKGEAFVDVVKMGRTQLQDAVPMTLGQEFTAYAVTMEEDHKRISEAADLVREINLGATAIGTRINSPAGYAEKAVGYLREISGVDVTLASNLIEATWDTGAYVQISGVIKRNAVKLSKICNDLRLLSSGPRAGLNEINLPKLQPGSSIMPGKVNPVIPEVVNQIAFHIIGADVTISLAAEAGQLQLNAMEPIIAFHLLQNIKMLGRGVTVLRELCINGIEANVDDCRRMVEQSIGIITAFSPALGYEKCAQIAKEAMKTGQTIRETIIWGGYMRADEVDKILAEHRL